MPRASRCCCLNSNGLRFSKRLSPSGELSSALVARYLADEGLCRLNTKVQARDVMVNDLVLDLSDGVNRTPLILLSLRKLSTNRTTGHSHTSSRSPG